ncbi:hypothetical protein BXY41_102383 [Lacrimispora xylanisolvens]|uniref:CobW/HypB/UreG nucleotide-binding domain-containing protein n=1 Tax=Lacrimispora xylanisolvens TaxID=384636 RepID=A0A2S6HXQ5_9FIRM|nr:permease [Hungatella xylanolytica]PPK82693.1 hypothetical protein BXY41_102383 [Hungatella xylanolytica]
MVIPAWVVTGFLDSGKTTLINRLIREELSEQEVLVIQFERGDTPLAEGEGVRSLYYSKAEIEESPYDVADSICEEIKKDPAELILIEWNGMEHFHRFEEMFLQFHLKPAIHVEKVIYAGDEKGLKHKIADSGLISMSQIAAGNLAYLRAEENAELNARELFQINPDIHVFTEGKWDRFKKKMFQYEVKSQISLLLVAAAAIFYLIANTYLGSFVTLFLGVFLQAVPFLVIGVLLSSAIQVYVSADWIRSKFPKNMVLGQLFAIVAGFCLPVCDCASIPVFKGLVKKGVPLSAAVTFMLVSPVINPVVILSTWYAFNGNLKIIAARCGLGMLCAVLTGLTCLISPPQKVLLADPVIQGGDGYGDYEIPTSDDSKAARFFKMMRHAQNEFFTVGTYLLTGIFVSTVLQEVWPGMTRSGGGIPILASVGFLMAMAFILSLCSSSDAIVARTMAGVFPAGALMGFLVFGPMIDLKNGAMLLGGFEKKFIVRLFVTTFLICFGVVGIFALLGSGGIRI